jgi:hypothetical protein
MSWLLVFYAFVAGSVQWGAPVRYTQQLADGGKRQETTEEIRVRCQGAADILWTPEAWPCTPGDVLAIKYRAAQVRALERELAGAVRSPARSVA